jgi:hypothetical protein
MIGLKTRFPKNPFQPRGSGASFTRSSWGRALSITTGCCRAATSRRGTDGVDSSLCDEDLEA